MFKGWKLKNCFLLLIFPLGEIDQELNSDEMDPWQRKQLPHITQTELRECTECNYNNINTNLSSQPNQKQVPGGDGALFTMQINTKTKAIVKKEIILVNVPNV